MKRSNLFALMSAAAGLTLVLSLALALPQQQQDKGAAQDMQLPPGWTQEDMQKMMQAGTPGEMQKMLADSAGTWEATGKSWMAPDTEPIESTSTAVITPIMDGRHIKMEIAGEMPGMGPFNGFAIYSYDNVAKRFQACWVDNMSTGQMVGTGELSTDGRTLTWKYEYTCPITDKPVTMREIETFTSKDTRTLEMYNIDPKSGQEYKAMELKLTRKGSTPARGTR